MVLKDLKFIPIGNCNQRLCAEWQDLRLRSRSTRCTDTDGAAGPYAT
ncbi:hypothetical protein CAter282_3571 [Collimonas arenae]|uniref:Uncharacterized protein n=1 Tax=Collimonas arenae TaxID=279058 RepID=A0A127QMG7_9BURK|nr:hypothetical protein CAter10_3908 [Collimonas arenae]AMP11257.1 hypothetical protein CAter282_3571 [Collimonas arenae]